MNLPLHFFETKTIFLYVKLHGLNKVYKWITSDSRKNPCKSRFYTVFPWIPNVSVLSRQPPLQPNSPEHLPPVLQLAVSNYQTKLLSSTVKVKHWSFQTDNYQTRNTRLLINMPLTDWNYVTDTILHTSVVGTASDCQFWRLWCQDQVLCKMP